MNWSLILCSLSKQKIGGYHGNQPNELDPGATCFVVCLELVAFSLRGIATAGRDVDEAFADLDEVSS